MDRFCGVEGSQGWKNKGETSEWPPQKVGNFKKPAPGANS